MKSGPKFGTLTRLSAKQSSKRGRNHVHREATNSWPARISRQGSRPWNEMNTVLKLTASLIVGGPHHQWYSRVSCKWKHPPNL